MGAEANMETADAKFRTKRYLRRVNGPIITMVVDSGALGKRPKEGALGHEKCHDHKVSYSNPFRSAEKIDHRLRSRSNWPITHVYNLGSQTMYDKVGLLPLSNHDVVRPDHSTGTRKPMTGHWPPA